ncbi:hypothetical protein EDC36_10155 [Tepidimonas ignava]|uniref:Uncharacterized protein n=1 Tax=Tepidimonas ignava TaxID=114249 RepID=A0A4R3LJV6_9BURK|nr:hypothetical protein EDC36_10155 [Tepidimonas ignava]TSE23173.1 hypothetical protein Tigna_00547 [Tepidimonas ignava]
MEVGTGQRLHMRAFELDVKWLRPVTGLCKLACAFFHQHG